MLEALDVGFTFPGRTTPVLDGISLTCAPGDVVGLMGPSGRGKTTLARLLAGYIAPTRGRIRLDGAPLPRQGAQPVQLAFQLPETAVDPRWTGRRILENGGPVDPFLLDAFGIQPDWLARYPAELSGGELQRLALIRALGPTTRYLVADEITAQLDPITQAEIWHALLALTRAAGLGLVVISHDRALIERIATRTVHLGEPEKI
jgi:peptide/nickel transport system ATP-binding protein